VDAGEGERLERIGRANDFGGLITSGAAAAKLEMVVEEEGAGSFASLDGEGGQGVIFFVELEHAGEVDGAEDVDVVEEEGLVETAGSSRKNQAAFFRPPPVSSRTSSREISMRMPKFLLDFR